MPIKQSNCMYYRFLFTCSFFLLISSLKAPLSEATIAQLNRVIDSKITIVKKASSAANKFMLLNKFIAECNPLPTMSSPRRDDPQFEEKARYISEKLSQFYRQLEEQISIEREMRRVKAHTHRGQLDIEEEAAEAARRKKEASAPYIPLSLAEQRRWVAHLEQQVQAIEKEIWRQKENPHSKAALERKHQELIKQLLRHTRELATWESHAQSSLDYLH